MTTRTNAELAKGIKGQRSARFCLCDFHVHSPASHDVANNSRLNDVEKGYLGGLVGEKPKDFVKHQSDVLAAFTPEHYLNELIKRRDAVVNELGISEYNKWGIIAITDHNVCSYAVELSKLAWGQRKSTQLIVMPGIELDVVFPVDQTEKTKIHVLCVFRPGVDAGDIRKAISDASLTDWKEGDESVNVSGLQGFVGSLRHHDNYPAMVIAAHVWSRKGLQNEVKSLLSEKEAAIARLEAEMLAATSEEGKKLQSQLDKLKADTSTDNVDDRLLKIVGECGFDALQVKGKSDEKHYRRLHRYREESGRSIPIVSSDAHCLDNVFCVSGQLYPQIKLTNAFNKLEESDFFDEVRDHAIRCGETRFSYTYGGEVTHWIEGIEIVRDSLDATEFWSETDGLVLPLSRNLNCLIGGRGSGKSAVIEALSFLVNPNEAVQHANQTSSKWDAWYMRARATLSGCNLRLCWRGFGDVDEDFKKGVFVSRYFDTKDRHSDIVVTDINGGGILGPKLPEVQLYRFHDIERASESEGLRKLIDDVSGGIEEIEEEIESVRLSLSSQGNEIISLAREINGYTRDGSPLRLYAKRLLAYENVNNENVAKHFEKLDEVERVGKVLRGVKDLWEVLSSKYGRDDIDEVERLIKEVSDVANKESNDNLNSLVKMVEGESPVLSQFLSNLRELMELKDKIGDEFKARRGAIIKEFTSIRDELERNGVPTGAKDREARKKELDESIESLNQYRAKINMLHELMGERSEIFNRLKALCKNRTDIRSDTAERITAHLARDLDGTVIQIRAEAQPMADKSAFENWLDSYLIPAFRSYKGQRINALLNGGLTPELTRDILLGKDVDWRGFLVRDIAKVSEGRVSEDDAQAIRALTAIAKHEPEVTDKTDGVSESVITKLPDEVKEGLLYFPLNDKDKLRLEDVVRLDEIVFNDIPLVYLNDRPQEEGSIFRPLHELSPGQRCSAVLPILLLNGTSPLIIDQPEDNLDNRLIRQVIVNVLGSIKLKRQVIVATHNPNIPVLGDAEQTIVLAAIDEKQSKVVSQGNLDSTPIVEAVTDIMEGGREAFQYRHTIYQSHWDGVVITS